MKPYSKFTPIEIKVHESYLAMSYKLDELRNSHREAYARLMDSQANLIDGDRVFSTSNVIFDGIVYAVSHENLAVPIAVIQIDAMIGKINRNGDVYGVLEPKDFPIITISKQISAYKIRPRFDNSNMFDVTAQMPTSDRRLVMSGDSGPVTLDQANWIKLPAFDIAYFHVGIRRADTSELRSEVIGRIPREALRQANRYEAKFEASIVIDSVSGLITKKGASRRSVLSVATPDTEGGDW